MKLLLKTVPAYAQIPYDCRVGNSHVCNAESFAPNNINQQFNLSDKVVEYEYNMSIIAHYLCRKLTCLEKILIF